MLLIWERKSILSLPSSLVHGGLELSIMNTSCHASHLDRDPNIIHQVETSLTRLKLPHSSRGSSPTCSGSVLRSTTNPSLISVFGIVSRSPSIFSPMAQRRWGWISHKDSKSQMKVNICKICHKVVAFSIDIADTEKWPLSITAFEKMVWPTIKQSENTEMFKSKLRYQATFYITNKNRSFCKIKWDDILVELYCRA